MKHFLLNSKNIERDGYLWNMFGSMIMAFQSVILLMFLTRTVGLAEAGVFTIAYANANLFLTIGKYGVRNFQVSDTGNEYTFGEYRFSRWMNAAAMLAVSVFYTIFYFISNSDALEKTAVIFWMCLLKIPDAIEDVYFGEYQRQGRLDVASKAMTLRMLSTMLVYALLLLLMKRQLPALIIAVCYSFVIMVIFLKLTIMPFEVNRNYSGTNVFKLLKACFPLFAGSFLSFYIGNAPKYAIETMLTDKEQACYGFISMPVFVIGLLNGFIFTPMLHQMALLREEGRIKQFIGQTALQMLYVILITLACMAGGWFLGIPVLSLLYNTDLSPYKAELLILLMGGGFLGMSGLLNAIITIMRRQNLLLIGYLAVALLAYLLSGRIVGLYGIMGASLLYTALMAALSLCFMTIWLTGLKREV